MIAWLITLVVLVIVYVVSCHDVPRDVEGRKCRQMWSSQKKDLMVMIKSLEPTLSIDLYQSNNGKAYCINKKSIYIPLCPGTLTIEQIRYMVIHELAHASLKAENNEVDGDAHGAVFRLRFFSLLSRAREMGYEAAF